MYCHPHPALLDFHTPEPRKIYLTQLTIELSSVLQPWLPCHRTVGDRANRGLQHGNRQKKTTDVQEGDTKRIKTVFWRLRFLDVLASIKVDQCIGGYRISAGKTSKFDCHIFTLMFKTFTDFFRCNTKRKKCKE